MSQRSVERESTVDVADEGEPAPARVPAEGEIQPALLTWLRHQWLVAGPAVCVVEGFAGLGKSYLADKLLGSFPRESALVELPHSRTSYQDLLLLILGALNRDANVSVPIGADIAAALHQALRRPILLVIDNFEQCLDAAGAVDPEFLTLLRRLCASPLPGRVLILTSHSVDEEDWTERGASVRTLRSLPAAAGGALLEWMLAERGRQDEVPAARAAGLADWLGSNPRAMRALVAALRYAPLEELVEAEPIGPQIGYRFVSEDLVKRLEERFLAKTLQNLTPTARAVLQALAVHRTSFLRAAIDSVHTGGKNTVDSVITELVGAFMVDRRRRWFSVNPTVRQLALLAVRRDAAALHRAHQLAADYYVRPFTAKQVTISANASNFLEARHHLRLAGRETELRELAKKFALHIQRTNQSGPLPSDPAELDEQIMLLQAALASGSPSSRLNYRLAQMLLARGGPEDRPLALIETTEAVRIPRAAEEIWLLHVQLLAETAGIDAAMTALEERAAGPDGPVSVGCWTVLGDLLARAGRKADAVALLRRVITEFRPVGREALYTRAARLADSTGDTLGALEVLREGIADREPAGCAPTPLYDMSIELQLRRNELGAAEDLLVEGLRRISPDQNLFSLYQSGLQLYVLRNDRAAALTLLDEGLRRVRPEHHLCALYVAGIELHAGHGDLDSALALLIEGLGRLEPEHHLSQLYVAGIELHSRRGDPAAALALFTEAMRRLGSDPHLTPLYLAGIASHIRRGDLDAALDLLVEASARLTPQRRHTALTVAGIEVRARRGELDEARALLTDGLRAAPEEHLSSLYQAGIQLHLRCGDLPAAMELGFTGLGRVLPAYQRHRLAEVALYAVGALTARGTEPAGARRWWDELDRSVDGVRRQLSTVLRLGAARQWSQAWSVAAAYRRDHGSYPPLLWQEVFCALAAGERATAAAAADTVFLPALGRGHQRRRPVAWLLSLVYGAVGRTEESWSLLAEYWQVEPDPAGPVAACVRIWHQQADAFGVGPRTLFPVLPPSIVDSAGVDTGAAVVRQLRRTGDRPAGPVAVDIGSVRGAVDFGILSIREDEFSAVLDRFPADRFAVGDQRYELSTVAGAGDQPYTVAAVRCLDQGQGYAQRVATHLINDLAPRWLLVVGIAGAVPSLDFSLGDVVCASRVHDFSVRAVKEGDRDTYHIGGGPAHPEVERMLASLPAIVRNLPDWNSEASIGRPKPALPVPGPRSARYYGAAAWRADVRRTLLHHFPPGGPVRPPLVTARSVAASDALVKSTELLTRWQESARAVAAVEMELGGVFLAARQVERQVPVLAIRGLSDIVGFNRDEEWTRFACASAASLAHALVTSGNLLRPAVRS